MAASGVQMLDETDKSALQQMIMILPLIWSIIIFSAMALGIAAGVAVAAFRFVIGIY